MAYTQNLKNKVSAEASDWGWGGAWGAGMSAEASDWGWGGVWGAGMGWRD